MIKEVIEVTETFHYVETDDSFPRFRRWSDGTWENLMGESWEPYDYEHKEMEHAFQQWLKK